MFIFLSLNIFINLIEDLFKTLSNSSFKTLSHPISSLPLDFIEFFIANTKALIQDVNGLEVKPFLKPK